MLVFFYGMDIWEIDLSNIYEFQTCAVKVPITGLRIQSSVERENVNVFDNFFPIYDQILVNFWETPWTWQDIGHNWFQTVC